LTTVGSYNVSEGAVSGYAGTYSADCTGTIALGETKACTITNDDQPSYLIINKLCTGGTSTFSFPVTGPSGQTPSVTCSTPVNNNHFSGTTGQLQVLPGSYGVAESAPPANWSLTASFCSVDGNNPFGTATVVGGIAVSWAFNIPLGTTVTCTFDNSLASQTTRTQGFWATHTGLANTVWAGVSAADASLCSSPITAIAATGQDQLLGGFWANVANKTTNPKQRTDLDKARMQMLQQYLAAVLNVYQFGSSYNLANARTIYCGTDTNAIHTETGNLTNFNESGDSGLFTPGVNATPKESKDQANISFWNTTTH